jgi:hypothetical protein
MKPLIILAAILLADIAMLAFGFATIRRESEVASHIFTDEGFARFRLISIWVGAAASLLDLLLLLKLYRLKRNTHDRQNA